MCWPDFHLKLQYCSSVCHLKDPAVFVTQSALASQRLKFICSDNIITFVCFYNATPLLWSVVFCFVVFIQGERLGIFVCYVLGMLNAVRSSTVQSLKQRYEGVCL